MNLSLTHLNFFFCLDRKSFLANHLQTLLQWYYKKSILLDANTPFASLFLDSPSLRITSKNWEWLISISYKVSRGSRVSECFLSPGSFLYTALIRHLKAVRTLTLSNLYLWKKQITSKWFNCIATRQNTACHVPYSSWRAKKASSCSDVLTLF